MPNNQPPGSGNDWSEDIAYGCGLCGEGNLAPMDTDVVIHGDVLDPFLGSGATALAARATGRHYVGIKCDESYAQIARERVEANLPIEPPSTPQQRKPPMNPVTSLLATFVRKQLFRAGCAPEVLVSPDDYASLRPYLDANRGVRVDGERILVGVDLGLSSGKMTAPYALPTPMVA